MRPTKKAISPVIAVALLLVVAVVAVIFFSTWFDSFRSALFTKVESDTANSQSVGIVDLVGDELFFQAGTGTAVSIVKVSGNNCEFSTGKFSGLHVFNLGSCLNASGDSVEATVLTDKQVYSQKFFVKEQYQSHELMPVLLWNVTYDGGFSDWGWDVLTDSDGVALVGESSNGTTFSCLLFQYDTNGNELWNRTFSIFENVSCNSLFLDKLGNFYLGGVSWNDLEGDFLLVKLDSFGNELWNVTYENGEDLYGWAVTVDDFGNAYITGESYTSENLFLVKYDSLGTQLWNITYENASGYGLTVDESGNIFVSGSFRNSDFLLVKYNSSGTELWNVTYAGSGYNEAHSPVLDKDGNIYITGYFENLSYDFLTLKYDSNGNGIWASFFNIAYEGSFSLVLDSLGNVYVGGLINTGGTYDYLIVKYDNGGNELWNISFDTGEKDVGKGLSIDASGNLYQIGRSYNGVDYDYLLVKYAQK
ncbi:hypothetical protein H6501_05235 [Candidatus Woesearchaeota archaeon]|nr:hypothetical protein [Candidatus Woesearchaeota archaeon]USN44078.1 MAG: hypothetical protein H6500_06850 [Candidatus Woesearchaeota archaeon]